MYVTRRVPESVSLGDGRSVTKHASPPTVPMKTMDLSFTERMLSPGAEAAPTFQHGIVDPSVSKNQKLGSVP